MVASIVNTKYWVGKVCFRSLLRWDQWHTGLILPKAVQCTWQSDLFTNTLLCYIPPVVSGLWNIDDHNGNPNDKNKDHLRGWATNYLFTVDCYIWIWTLPFSVLLSLPQHKSSLSNIVAQCSCKKWNKQHFLSARTERLENCWLNLLRLQSSDVSLQWPRYTCTVHA